MAACFGITLLPVFALNLVLFSDTLGNNRKALLASQWQAQTSGITYAPTQMDTHLFKTLRLNDRLPEINTVVFGSSTVLSLTQQAFPPRFSIYNYAQNAHLTGAAISEAFWVIEHSDVVNLVMPMDWSLGHVYERRVPMGIDLSFAESMRQAQTDTPVPLSERMRDALSYPRIFSLLDIIGGILRAEDTGASFRGYFMQGSGDPYRCPDGSMARDFDIAYRGTCLGFRFDGSSTFANQQPVADPQALITSAIMPDSIYVKRLRGAQGMPSVVILDRLASLARRAEAKGGKLILIMPPLLPGFEATFANHPAWSPYLLRTKQILADWAAHQNVVVIDAGRSERFGCRAEEFVDPHHALPGCFNKVFWVFWNKIARKEGDGIFWPAGGMY